MTINLSIVSDALRSVNVLDETETASPEQGSHCLREMNQMLATWEVDGICLGYFPQTSTAAVCPIPDWAEAGVKYKLGLRVSSHYGAQVPIGAIAAAEEGYGTILRVALNQKLQPVDMSHMPMGTGHCGGYDIESGQ